MPAKTVMAASHLTPATADWWLHVCGEFDLEQHHVRLLTLAAETFDCCQQAREIIDKDGPICTTADSGLKAHPAIAVKRDSRLAFARLLRELDLDAELPAERTRPPGLRSNRRAM